MVNNKSRITIAAIATLLTFLSVAYVSSCTKPGANKYSCEGVVCLNGGICDSGWCVCPTGYEGANCSIASVAKYIGTWKAMQVIVGTDSTRYLHDTSRFIVFLKNTATPTTFFIDNFNGDPYYGNVICTLDTGINSNLFTIDTLSGFDMIYGHYQLQWGNGSISSNDSTITATFCVRFANGSVNWEVDTVSLILTPYN